LWMWRGGRRPMLLDEEASGAVWGQRGYSLFADRPGVCPDSVNINTFDRQPG
jgi:hypothetical protein